MRILGIETSCDETAAAAVEDGMKVLSNVIASSKTTFASLGGVIPEEAARRQVECIMPVIGKALGESGCDWNGIDAIAVTKGPGLLGSLLVGTASARAIAMVHGKPVIGVHHTLGHLSSAWLEVTDSPVFPVLTLSVSGGHTDLWLRTSHTKGTLIGRTRDDAAGEAFDKGASMLGLPYPGGPSIAKAAESGDEHSYDFPLPLHKEETPDFSFSGLKTSLRYLLRDKPSAGVSDVAASFQLAICKHLCDRVRLALELHPFIREVHVVGGVSANVRLRLLLEETLRTFGGDTNVRWPSQLAFCTDNAAMIAAAGYFLRSERGAAATGLFRTEASLALEETVIRESTAK